MDYHRRSIRLDGYDYSKSGMYFVTIDVQGKLKLFWDEKKRNERGLMIGDIITEIPERYPGVGIDEFIIMPDHVHMIIKIVGADPRICPISINNSNGVGADPRICPKDLIDPRQGRTPTIGGQAGSARTFGQINTLAGVIQRFKMLTTKRYIDGVNNYGWPRFLGRLWQRDYFERIIRNEFELNRIRKYIRENPLKIMI